MRKSCQKLFLINHLTCANDTGIESCGSTFEYIEQIYIHKWTKTPLTEKAPASTEGSVILVIKEHDTQRRYFKGTWNFANKTVASWNELMPEIAELEISRSKSIVE